MLPFQQLRSELDSPVSIKFAVLLKGIPERCKLSVEMMKVVTSQSCGAKVIQQFAGTKNASLECISRMFGHCIGTSSLDIVSIEKEAQDAVENVVWKREEVSLYYEE